MRALLPLVLLLALAPVASAAGSFELGAERIVERALDPGSEAVFEMPLVVNQDGHLYAKLLPTENNAAHDGFRANGSIGEDKGWIVRFALVDAAGERRELGAFVDSTSTELVPVAKGDRPTLIATVRIPADAAIGGPRQAIYVAVAYRSLAASGPGGASGASMDEARALTLLMTNDLLPPAAPGEAPAEEPAPQESVDAEIPPVGPIQESAGAGGVTNVTVEPLPAWFLVGALVVGALLALALGAVALAIFSLRRDVAQLAPPRAARSVPVRAEERDERVAPSRARE